MAVPDARSACNGLFYDFWYVVKYLLPRLHCLPLAESNADSEMSIGRKRSCFGSWRQDEQISAGLFLLVAVGTFLVKASPTRPSMFGKEALLTMLDLTARIHPT